MTSGFSRWFAAALAVVAQASQAQPSAWEGGYVGGLLGYASQSDDNEETILFDTDLDGSFGDVVRRTTGSNYFSDVVCGARREGTFNPYVQTTTREIRNSVCGAAMTGRSVTGLWAA